MEKIKEGHGVLRTLKRGMFWSVFLTVFTIILVQLSPHLPSIFIRKHLQTYRKEQYNTHIPTPNFNNHEHFITC